MARLRHQRGPVAAMVTMKPSVEGHSRHNAGAETPARSPTSDPVSAVGSPTAVEFYSAEDESGKRESDGVVRKPVGPMR